MPPPSRLAPDVAFPTYAYVPGAFPHPWQARDGHRHRGVAGAPPSAEDWPRHRGYRHALDLLNHGYYWEAHEVLEEWWRALPAADPRRPLVHGLLRLAAAGVKAREGRPHGVGVHARAAATLLTAAAACQGGADPLLLGLRPARLAGLAASLARRAGSFTRADPMPPVASVLGLALVPESAADTEPLNRAEGP